MILHWAKFVFGVVLAFSLSHEVLGCYDDECGYGECCENGICSTCDSSSSISTGIIAVIVVVVVIFKVTFWILYCYCRRRRAGVILVRNPYVPFQNTASTIVVSNQSTSSSSYPPPSYPPPMQQQPGYSHPAPPPHAQQPATYSHPQPPPHAQQQPGFPFPQQTVPMRDNMAMKSGDVAPPPYTENIQS